MESTVPYPVPGTQYVAPKRFTPRTDDLYDLHDLYDLCDLCDLLLLHDLGISRQIDLFPIIYDLQSYLMLPGREPVHIVCSSLLPGGWEPHHLHDVVE